MTLVRLKVSSNLAATTITPDAGFVLKKYGHEVNLYEDYRHYMGEPPAQITRVWFIAVSIFQRGEGACDYADIVLHDAESMIRLL